jgi:hypothetical protein
MSISNRLQVCVVVIGSWMNGTRLATPGISNLLCLTQNAVKSFCIAISLLILHLDLSHPILPQGMQYFEFIY